MFAVFFVLGRTWRKWDGWTSGKLFARNAVMDEGTGKFGVYDSEDRAGCIPERDDSFAFCSAARLKFYKNSSVAVSMHSCGNWPSDEK